MYRLVANMSHRVGSLDRDAYRAITRTNLAVSDPPPVFATTAARMQSRSSFRGLPADVYATTPAPVPAPASTPVRTVVPKLVAKPSVPGHRAFSSPDPAAKPLALRSTPTSSALARRLGTRDSPPVVTVSDAIADVFTDAADSSPPPAQLPRVRAKPSVTMRASPRAAVSSPRVAPAQPRQIVIEEVAPVPAAAPVPTPAVASVPAPVLAPVHRGAADCVVVRLYDGKRLIPREAADALAGAIGSFPGVPTWYLPYVSVARFDALVTTHGVVV